MFSPDEKKKIKSQIDFGILLEGELEDLSKLIRDMNTESPEYFWLRSNSREYYFWMYFKNPIGKAIVFRAKYDNKIIASFALAPKKMKIGEEIRIVGKTMDMFTHPDYQGLGLMSILHERVTKAAIDQNINAWYVTPSKNSYPIFMKKWNYIENFEIAYRLRILDIVRFGMGFLKKATGLKQNIHAYKTHRKVDITIRVSGSEYCVRETKIFDERVVHLLEKYNSGNKIGLIKDLEYLNWRYFENPDRYIALNIFTYNNIFGIIVLKETIRKGLKIGEIVDYIWDPDNPDSIKVILKIGLRILKSTGCVVGESWVVSGLQYEKMLKNAGLNIKKKKRVKLILSPDSPYRLLYNKDSWVLTQGDGNDI